MDKAVRDHSRKLLGASISVLVSLSTGSAYAQSVEGFTDEQIRVGLLCRQETDHVKLYEYGKTLALGWDYWLKKKSKDGPNYNPKTRISFMSTAQTYSNMLFKVDRTGDNALNWACRTGYGITADKVPWSSVQQGLVDYLSPAWKSKFLSLPER
jgi:hypothetical protein